MSAAQPARENPANARKEVPAGLQVVQMLTGKWLSQAISAAAELGIADQLAHGPQSVEHIAAATGAHAPSVYRLLRALASVGVFAETDDRRFTLTPLAETLRSDSPGSVRNTARFFGGRLVHGSWAEIVNTIRTGETGVKLAFGAEAFEYLEANPAESALFNAAMTDYSRQEGAAVAQTYDFSRLNRLVDIAGGHGFLLQTVLQRNPHLTGVVFDLPHVIESAGPAIASYGLDGRLGTATGDFFQSVPAGADGYLLKHIVHDWDDERAAAILRNCHDAMAPNGRLLVIEVVIPPGNEPSFGKLLDLEMLSVAGGRERTEGEYRELFAAAGFRLAGVYPTASPVSIVEGVRAGS